MKNKVKLLIFPVLAVLFIAVLVVSILTGNKKTEEVTGNDGIIYEDYFTGNAASKDWKIGFHKSVLNPETVKDSLHFSGSGVRPSAAMLGVALPKDFDVYFTANIVERGGDSRDAGVFFCVEENYEERYQIILSEGTVKVKYNGTTDVAVKKLEALKAGFAYSFHIKVTGSRLEMYFEGADEPCLKLNASGQFASFEQARTFGVFSYAKDFYFDNLVITNGKDFIPITKIDIAGKDNKSIIEGLGNTLQMDMFVNPSNATDLSFVWSVDNGQLADITQDGLLTAKGYGTVTVSARTRDGSNLSVSKKVRIAMGQNEANTSKMYTNRKALLTEGYTLVQKAKNSKDDVTQTSVVTLSGGRIVTVANGCVSYTDDGGKTWAVGMKGNFSSGSVFEVDDTVYMVTANGKDGQLVIYSSANAGEKWSNKKVLDTRKWRVTPSKVLLQNGCVYLTMDVECASAVSKGYKGDAAFSPIVMRAEVGTDLTKAKNWTFSSEFAYADIMQEGTAEVVDYVDVPNNYGDTKSTGWAAGNLLQFYDKEQLWYDEDMKTFFIYSHGNAGNQGYATLVKVTETANGTMVPSLVETVTAKKKLMFVPMPGGNQSFNILYDVDSGLYWQVSNYLNEENRVALYFSKNAYDWSFAGIVAQMEGGECLSPTVAIDGKDLVIVANQSDGTACYRVADFRSLVY